MNESMNQTPVAPKKSIAPWLLITFIIVLLAGGGYLGYYFWNKSQTKTATPTATTAVTPLTSTDATAPTTSTADWKTYMNSDYKFSLKYPKDWTLVESLGSVDQPLQVQLSSPNDNAEMGPSFSVTIDHKDSVADITNLNTDRYSSYANFKKTTETLVGQAATHITYTDHYKTEATNTFSSGIFIFSKDTNTYIISSQGYADYGYVSNIDYILHSFQFTP